MKFEITALQIRVYCISFFELFVIPPIHLVSLLIFFYAAGFGWPGILPGMTVAVKQETNDKTQASATVDETEIVIDRRVVIGLLPSSQGRERFDAGVDLSTLEGGKKYRINITLVNPFDRSIRFDNVSMSCGCAKFEANSREIPEFGHESFVLRLNVSTTQLAVRKLSQSVSFASFDNPLKEILRLRFSYDVNNVYSFGQSRADIEISETEETANARIPIMLVPPMTLDQLQLGTPKDLKGVRFEIIKNDDSSEPPYLLIEAARETIPPHGLTGEVMLRHIASGEKSRIQYSVSHQEIFKIRPESLRLARDNQSKPYEAVAMLRVSPRRHQISAESGIQETENAPTFGATTKPTPPTVELDIGGEKAMVSVIQFGQSDVYRLIIRFDDHQLANVTDDTLDVRWKIGFGDVERVINSHAFLSNR